MFKLPYFIHIGLPRTASTWLQGLFKKHPEVCFLFRSRFFNWEDFWAKGFDYHENLLINQINSFHKAILESDESYSVGRRIGKTNWSEERLRRNQQREKIEKYYLPSDPYLIAKRIKLFQSNAKIILVLRRQSEWLLSNYRFLVGSQGESFRFEEFLKNEKYHDIINAGFYSNLVNLYFDLFEKENVLILFYEDLKSNPCDFLEKISVFLGISSFNVTDIELNKKVRSSLSNRAIKIKQKANIITQKLSNKRNSVYYKLMSKSLGLFNRIIFKRIPDTYILSDNKRKEIVNYYKQDNLKLVKLINKDLSKLGYF